MGYAHLRLVFAHNAAVDVLQVVAHGRTDIVDAIVQIMIVVDFVSAVGLEELEVAWRARCYDTETRSRTWPSLPSPVIFSKKCVLTSWQTE